MEIVTCTVNGIECLIYIFIILFMKVVNDFFYLLATIGLDLEFLSHCAQEGEMMALARPGTTSSSVDRVKSAPTEV